LTNQLCFERVAIRGLRNLRATELPFSSSLNIFVGDNGQGKTSLLEALCIAATGRSFRTEQLREVVQTGMPGFGVLATLVDDGLSRAQQVAYADNRRQVFVDRKRVSKVSAFAVRAPIVVFSPSDLELVTGPAATRRNLLDRIAIYTDPLAQDCRLAYARALRHRQLLLDKSDSDQKALPAFETILAEQGLRYAQAHSKAALALCQFLQESFAELSSNSLNLEAHFVGMPITDEATYRRELADRRTSDRRRGRATLGPHRDELQLSLEGRSARHHASQGQQRLLALALKLSELRCIEAARQAYPILLLDDVASELDLLRTGSVFEWLRDAPNQVFLTTPRPDLLQDLQLGRTEQRKFSVIEGQIQATE